MIISVQFTSVKQCTSVIVTCLLWAFFVFVLNHGEKQDETMCILLKITLKERNLMTNAFINFVNSNHNHIQLYPGNHMFWSCTKRSRKSDTLSIGRDQPSMCWHQNLSKKSKQDLNLVQKSNFHQLSQETNVSIKCCPLLEPQKSCLVFICGEA
jgi:hypothetical protein